MTELACFWLHLCLIFKASKFLGALAADGVLRDEDISKENLGMAYDAYIKQIADSIARQNDVEMQLKVDSHTIITNDVQYTQLYFINQTHFLLNNLTNISFPIIVIMLGCKPTICCRKAIEQPPPEARTNPTRYCCSI